MIVHKQFLGDAEREFALPHFLIEELQRQCGAGIALIAGRVLGNAYSLSDLHQTIRLALIGGGTDPEEAVALMKAYVLPRPINEAWALAVEIINAVFYGVEPAATEEVAA
ncbi:gene transfer agent family protein [Aureimonas psammosilenae]|uniref:gene transfer agent family protein n=1 Tax=Aureimonas psammosilenae TaxID=2495496 RepID=UPI00126112A0|nr:gene transfer agent family protein [Aureimonas psammosilenae]